MVFLLNERHQIRIPIAGHNEHLLVRVLAWVWVHKNVQQAASLDWTGAPQLEAGYRFAQGFGEFLVAYRFLTTEGQLVYDPFAGSNITGAAAESLGRRWISTDTQADYVEGSRFRFEEFGVDGAVGNLILSPTAKPRAAA